MNEAAEPLESFKTFNEFFYRKLKSSARPIANPEHPDVLVSSADCRLTAFTTVDDATRCWIKASFALPPLAYTVAVAGYLSRASTLRPEHGSAASSRDARKPAVLLCWQIEGV